MCQFAKASSSLFFFFSHVPNIFVANGFLLLFMIAPLVTW